MLASHTVDYVLVGGLAALAHGSTIATADADVLPRLDNENLGTSRRMQDRSTSW